MTRREEEKLTIEFTNDKIDGADSDNDLSKLKTVTMVGNSGDSEETTRAESQTEENLGDHESKRVNVAFRSNEV